MLEQNKAIVRRHRLEIANEGKLDVVDEIFAATFTMNGQEMTPESFKQAIQMWRIAFPDLEYTLEDLIAEGDGLWSVGRVEEHIKEHCLAFPRQVSKSQAQGFSFTALLTAKL